jgi:hypothetical protein
MKLTQILVVILILPSCMTAVNLVTSGANPIDALTMSHFDSNEYGIITKMRTVSQLVDCGSKDSIKDATNKLWFYSNELQNFTQYVPRNEKSYKMAQGLNDIVKGLHNKNGDMSKMYCQEKFKVIQDTTENIQQATGKKPR